MMNDEEKIAVRQETSRLAQLLLRKIGIDQLRRTLENACGKCYIPDMSLEEMVRARSLMRTRLDEYIELENQRLHAAQEGKRIREWNSEVDRRKHEKKMRRLSRP